ncbi:hypothetical protein PTKIN_Ptkin14bG0116800 [Pterospermum kingtungense]
MEKEIRILCLLLALLHFQVDCSWGFPSSSHLCLPDQKSALLEFKSTISIDDDYCEVYPRTNSWDRSIDCCSWEGVSCNNVTGRVIGINLSESCLRGSILANNSLFHLHHLQWLDLSSNWLDGSLLQNSSLFHLHELQRLNLAHNHFNGPISSEFFSRFVSLTHLNLSSSGFSADFIPHQISLLSNLVSLDLSIDDFSGLMRVAAQGFDMLARNLTKLRTLVLDYVDMSGVSVTSFLNLTSSLEHLSLGFCQLHGEFPSEVFGFPYLQHIDLDGNKNLTGYLPETNLSSALKLLDLSGCGFRGSIPISFGNLTQIISIDLYGNSFEGQIPNVFGSLNKLTSLTFSSCNFSGQLPTTLFNLTKITQLDLSHNQLSGELPAVFNLTQISHLDLSYNQLKGSLPNRVSELQLLEVFCSSNNLVSGRVPSWLFTLPSLQKLDLSYNKLTGPIDRIQRPNSVQDVDLSYNNIHGAVPDSFFDLVGISLLNLSSNNLSGVIKSDMLLKLRSLKQLDLSKNSLLSLSTSDNDGNYSFLELEIVSLSSCSITQFPNFFRTSGLKSLDLSNNNISGGISKWEAEGWEQLTMLNLSYNSLTTLEQFPGMKLEVLDLHSNMLQGPILSTCLNLQLQNPPQFLKAFFISENKLTGNIPSFICNWSLLMVLDLSKNSLSGTIPECLGYFSSSLEVMNLQMNNFSGKIPDSFTNDRLRSLLLDANQLDGPLPKTLANCSSLGILNLGNNKLIDTFPHWIASLPGLQVLVLGFNRLHGPLPNSIAPSEFSALRIIDLSRNEFSGPLPTQFFQNLRAMKDLPSKPLELPRFEIYIHRSTYHSGDQYDFYYQTSVKVRTKRSEIELVKTLAIFIAMDISSNHFSGQIPEELGQLIFLQMLNFSRNNFSGPIPSSLGNLAALESLDLSSNKLGGRIPSHLTNLTFLEALNLSENNLVGPIPQANQFGTFDNDSYSGNLGLCGFPLSKQCGNPEGPKPTPPKFKEDEGSGIAFIWKLVMMGYGCGWVLGLSIGYIVFTTGRPWWFVRMVETDFQRTVTRWIRRNQRRRN